MYALWAQPIVRSGAKPFHSVLPQRVPSAQIPSVHFSTPFKGCSFLPSPCLFSFMDCPVGGEELRRKVPMLTGTVHVLTPSARGRTGAPCFTSPRHSKTMSQTSKIMTLKKQTEFLFAFWFWLFRGQIFNLFSPQPWKARTCTGKKK